MHILHRSLKPKQKFSGAYTPETYTIKKLPFEKAHTLFVWRKQMVTNDALHRGTLANGKRWQVDFSRTSAVPAGMGRHLVLTFTDDKLSQDEIPMSDRRELLGVAYEITYKLAVAHGRFRIELNGPAAASRPHFHIHIICPHADFKIRRVVDPIAAPAS